MTLRDAIIEHQNMMSKDASHGIATLLGNYQSHDSIDSKGFPSEELVNYAHHKGTLTLSEDDLVYLMDMFYSKDPENPVYNIRDETVQSALKASVKAEVEYYQTLLGEEGKASTFEEAVVSAYGNKQNYRRALQPMADANRELSTAIMDSMPEVAQLMFMSQASVLGSIECSMRYVFNGN